MDKEMNAQPTMTAKQQQDSMAAMNNPTGCMSHAWFYAFMSAQKETADLLQGKFNEIGELVDSLRDSGIISDAVASNGHCAMDVQRFLDTTKIQDVRIERLRALTNLRFMVEVTPPSSAMN